MNHISVSWGLGAINSCASLPGSCCGRSEFVCKTILLVALLNIDTACRGSAQLDEIALVSCMSFWIPLYWRELMHGRIAGTVTHTAMSPRALIKCVI